MFRPHWFRSGFAVALLGALSLSQAGCGEPDPAASSSDDVVQKVNEGSLTLAQGQSVCHCQLQVVRVGGTVFHFGFDLSQSPPAFFPFQSTVPGTLVSIAELPITRQLNVRSDANGKWSVSVVKIKGVPLHLSFVYENPGFVTTKSQVFDIGDGGISDLSVQFPTQAYFTVAKAQIEQQIGALIGVPYTLNNIVVTTVGKAWASMFNPMLPHGDPGAQVAISPAIQFPASVGPIYFNESVAPDPTINATSVDGGVLFGNLASGRYSFTAIKAPFTYSTVNFVIQDGIGLYIASPPHGIQSSNDSLAGLP
jgi:hypothetical protein